MDAAYVVVRGGNGKVHKVTANGSDRLIAKPDGDGCFLDPLLAKTQKRFSIPSLSLAMLHTYVRNIFGFHQKGL